VRAVIETQLRDVRWTGVMPRATGTDLPSVDMSPFSIPTQPPTSQGLVVLEPPATNPSVPVPISPPISIAPTNSGAAVPMPPAAPSRSMAVPLIVAAVAAIAVVGVGIKVLIRSPEPAAAAVTSATGAATTDPKATAPEAITLTVRTKPAEARIYLDGVLISTGPFQGKVLRSDKKRVVRVEAERYMPKEEEITVGADMVLSFDLEKDDRATPVKTSKPATGAAPGPAANPRGGAKPQHDIDSDSPYKK
jgi:serine/threonine-protein kinase